MLMSAHLRPHTYTATTEHSLQNHGLCGKLSSHRIARDRAVRVNQFTDPLLVAVGIWPMVPRESPSPRRAAITAASSQPGGAIALVEKQDASLAVAA